MLDFRWMFVRLLLTSRWIWPETYQDSVLWSLDARSVSAGIAKRNHCVGFVIDVRWIVGRCSVDFQEFVGLKLLVLCLRL